MHHFHICGHFRSFAGKEIFIFFLFSLYPSIIAMEIGSLQSDLTILRLHMQAVCYSIVFSEDRTAQRHTVESWNRMGLVIDGQIVLILCPNLHLVEPDFAFARISCYIRQQLKSLCRLQCYIEQAPCLCITLTFKLIL
jgi:hypothetical protein